jgi:hypothetical protein
LQGFVEDFEERAKLIYSGWVFKPNAEKGVVLSRKLSKSALLQDIESGNIRDLSQDQVQELLRTLDGVLEGVSYPSSQMVALALDNELVLANLATAALPAGAKLRLVFYHQSTLTLEPSS